MPSLPEHSTNNFTIKPRLRQQAKTEAQLSVNTEARLFPKMEAESDCMPVLLSPRIQGVSSRCLSFQSSE